MSLEKSINDAIKTAMKAKDKESLAGLRAIKSAILLAKTEKGAAEDLTEDQELKILTKQAKQRRDSAQVYKEQGREDLAAEEEAELKIIAQFLPEQMNEEQLKQEITALIAESNASSMADMGRVMGIASKKFAGKADGKAISAIVRQLLSN